jgi:replication-associated recombination protein RarA
MTLAETYRPKTLTDVIGQEKAVSILRRLSLDLGGRAYYITGQSGTGKTTLAKIIAGQVADQKYTLEVVGRLLTPATLKNFVDQWPYSSLFGKSGYALIVNESHGLSKPVIEILLDILENLPSHVVVIFTTTKDAQTEIFEEKLDASPFMSRCLLITLTSRGLCTLFAARLKEIAGAEGLDGQPIEAYERLLKDCRNNFRAALQQVEAGQMLV